MYLELARRLLEWWYLNAEFPHDLFTRYVEAVEELSGKVSPDMLMVEIARTPPNRPIYIVGAPGIGKTSTCLRFAELESRVIGRELVLLNLYNDPRDIEHLLEEAYRDPARYYFLSYITGGEITREFYAIPVGAYLDIDKLLNLAKSGSVQYWQIPVRVLVFTFLRRKIDLRILMGEVPLSPSLARELLNEVSIGVLIIDEALQAFPEFVRNYIMTLTGQRMWAGRHLSPLARLVLIWNPREHNEAVLDPPLPTFRRGCIVHVSAPSREEVWNYFVKLYREYRGKEPPTFLYTLLNVVCVMLSSRDEMRDCARRYLPYNTPASIVAWLLELADLCQYEATCLRYGKYLARRYLSPDSVARLELYEKIKVPTGSELLRDPSLFREVLQDYAKRSMLEMEVVKHRMLMNLVDEIVEKNVKVINQLVRFLYSNADLITSSELQLMLSLVRRRLPRGDYMRLIDELGRSTMLPEGFRKIIKWLTVMQH